MRDMREVVVCESRILRWMTDLLRLLTITAGMVISLGGILLLARHGDAVAQFHNFAGQPSSLRLVPLITAGAFHGHALAMIQFGILLLIATPVVRVAFIGIGYAVERDWLYLTVAIIVLVVLASSLVGHKP
jgi:uncharacterized membrane protein